MKLTSTLLACLYGAAVSASNNQDAGDYKPRYRISPIDGSKIALPTKEQLDFQDKEIGVLIHFNIATYLDIDGCNNVPSLVPNTSLFDPASLNTDQWMESITNLGAKYATLTAKHNCGFTLWPSDVKFPTKDGKTVPYNYTIAQSPVGGEDAVRKFVNSAKKSNVGHGFYYSVVVNNYLNVQNSDVRPAGTWAAGQVNITNSTYDEVVFDQLTELWTEYGDLAEIWFDGGYSNSQKGKIQSLLEANQPNAIIYNGCDTNGSCISSNSVRWIGTEEGKAPEENWSTGVTNDGGSPTSPIFCPSECDTTLQTQDRWFYGVNQSLRSPQEMIDVYHRTVGRNCLLELDLTPDRNGLIPPSYAERYKELGDFIKSCYGNPKYSSHEEMGEEEGVYRLLFDEPTKIDRIVLMEDQAQGQVIRSYGVYGRVVKNDDDGEKGTGSGGGEEAPFSKLSNGTSIGHKKIDLFDGPVAVTEVMVNTTFVDTPRWRSVTVHLCD